MRGVRDNVVLTGSSVHNQRIERQWRDCFRLCLKVFYKLFLFLEKQGLYNEGNLIHCFSLQYVYLSRIELALSVYLEAWNNHKLSTENNKTPNQLITEGLFKVFHSKTPSNSDIADKYKLDLDHFEFYGVEDDDINEESFPTDPNNLRVKVKPSELGLDKQTICDALSEVDVLMDDDNYGIDIYCKVVEILTNLVDM